MYQCICGNKIHPARYEAGYYVCLQCGEAAARKEMLRKARQVTLAYNKGPYMYITPGTDTASLGKKSGSGDGER